MPPWLSCTPCFLKFHEELYKSSCLQNECYELYQLRVLFQQKILIVWLLDSIQIQWYHNRGRWQPNEHNCGQSRGTNGSFFHHEKIVPNAVENVKLM